MQRFLGVDLGGCRSQTTAVVEASFCLKTYACTLHHTAMLPATSTHHACNEQLMQTLSGTAAEHIGIDAPFTLPNALLNKPMNELERTSTLELDNPYLYRYTDYFIYKFFQLKPMPPAGDRIGRLSARMVELFSNLRYEPPTLYTPNKKQLYEVYPKQVAQALGVTNYKKNYARLAQRFALKRPLENEHLYDALLASFAACMIAQGRTIFALPKYLDEGWCYPIVL